MTKDEIAIHQGSNVVTPPEMLQSDVSEAESNAPKGKSYKSTFKCKECDFECTNYKTIKKHHLQAHNIGKALICNCGFVFLRSENYDSHIKVVTKEKNAVKYEKIIKALKRENNCPEYRWKHDKYITAPKPDETEYVKAYASHYENYILKNFNVLCKVQKDLF